MPSQEVIVRSAAFIEQGTQFEVMLKEWGLPSENIIASADERIRLVEIYLASSLLFRQNRDKTQHIYLVLLQAH